ncbi:MAG TPA: hypothetical protein VKP66_21240 [Steroidobacteraceae bacterium]|nr:hypothetical protein [Steroidobacteraceae bacterium]
MKLQYLCHLPSVFLLAGATIFIGACAVSGAAFGQTAGTAANSSTPPAHDYPTVARVEYVNECIGKNGGKLAALYQCACAIDRIANALSYDDYVEASTFAKYSNLPGEGGGIFRDSERARRLAKSFRDLEADALRGCGMAH